VGQNLKYFMNKKYIPLDKYWTLRMGVLDILNGYKDINNFLSQQTSLAGDILALKNVAEVWETDKPVDVSECGTLYRMLQFASWKKGLNKIFITHATLTDRITRGAISQDPNIVNLSLQELLKLDKGTSQWATAAILCGNTEKLENPEYHIALTYEAREHWHNQRRKREVWEPRYDETIDRQAETFLKLLNGEKPEYIPVQPDEYLFARTFSYMSRAEGEKRWPRLAGHESSRFEEMDKVIAQVEMGETIASKDHRVIQAITMWGIVNKKQVKIAHKDAVNKSWPQFWDFLAQLV